MAIKKHLLSLFRLVPIGVVGLVMVCSGVLFNSHQTSFSSANAKEIRQGGLTSFDLINLFFEGEEYLEESEEDKNQFQEEYHHFKSGHFHQSGKYIERFQFELAQYQGFKNKSVHLVFPFYEAYCQLKIDC